MLDFVGLSGRNPNLYVYAFNSPLLVRDPTGQIPIPVISAGISIVAYSVIQVATGQEITPGGLSAKLIKLDHTLYIMYFQVLWELEFQEQLVDLLEQVCRYILNVR